MERQYIRVTPSRESINPDDIVSHISSLHKVTTLNRVGSIASRMSPFSDSDGDVPLFEFLAVCQGQDSPVEFFYGTTPEHIETLETRLTTAYPPSFNVELTTVDVLEKIIPPERYTPQDFVKQVKEGHLLFNPDATGTEEDIAGGSDATAHRSTNESGADATGGAQSTGEGNGSTGANETGQENRSEEKHSPYIRQPGLELDVARASENTVPSEEDAITDTNEKQTLSKDDIDGYDMLAELDAGLLDYVDLPEEVTASKLNHDVDGPTWTEDGEILARPTLENGQPVAITWNGSGERKKDWMTTLKMFSKVAEPGSEDIQDRAPLATLIQHLSSSDLPIAFQAVFQRIEDWSRQAEKRKDNLHLNRDTLRQKFVYEVGELIHKPSRERRRERKRDHMEDIGESADTNEQSPVTGDVGKRRKLIDNKIPKRTFRVNLRAVSVANRTVPVEDVERSMHNLTSTLDHIDGYFYELEPDIYTDNSGMMKKKKATKEFHRLVNREMVSGSGRTRPDLIMNADELANFIAVPSSENLTVGGVRGTRAEAESRDPLPKPDPDLMRDFHEPGMRVGYALDKEDGPEPVPTQVPPKLLTKHYGRFATTGAGKSKALINDILSLHENTSGPVVLIDPKGDGMTENYMKAHYERFGEENFKENVIHYPIPDILPGFTFFNIEPALNQGMRRSDAIQNKADHYQELLKLVMGRESYEDSKVAPTLISALIKALFDEHYVNQKQREAERGETDTVLGDRVSANKFTHRHLEKLTKQVRRYGITQGEQGEIPDVSNDAVRDTLEEQAQGDAHTFSTIMNAVTNRLNYIREDKHMREMFNNTDEKFDFRNHLNDDKVILFDMGDLRDDATMVMTGLILTNLWDALQESDRSTCTHGHESIEVCRNKARRNGLSPDNPQCRKEWNENHLVNLIIDEAASVASSSILNKMLEQGRSFHLSVGLSMQFPEQIKSAGSDRVYKNVLNNIATKLIGKITLDEEIAKAMSHEAMDVETFSDRIKALPRGEWITQLPSPTFMQTGPEPFSIQPMPIPAGHPESEQVFNSEAKQRFNHTLANGVHRRTREKYGINQDEETASASPNDKITQVNGTSLKDGEETNSTATTNDTSESPPEPNTEYDDTTMGEVNLPDNMIDAESFDSDGEQYEAESEAQQAEATSTDGGKAVQAQAEMTQGEKEETNTTEQETPQSEDKQSEITELKMTDIMGRRHKDEDLPGHIKWDNDIGMFTCRLCNSEYFPGERATAATCCEDTVVRYAEKYSHIDSLTSHRGNSDTQTYDYTISAPHSNLSYSISGVLPVSDISAGDVAVQTDITIKRPMDILDATNQADATALGSVLAAVKAAIPPRYQLATESLIEWVVEQLQSSDETTFTDALPSISYESIALLIHSTPPADVDVDVSELIKWVDGSKEEAVNTNWDAETQVEKASKRFISGSVSFPGTDLHRIGTVGITYHSPTVNNSSSTSLGTKTDGMSIAEEVHTPLCISFDNITMAANETSNGTTGNGQKADGQIDESTQPNQNGTQHNPAGTVMLAEEQDPDKSEPNGTVELPIETVELPGVTQSDLREYNITKSEAKFMAAVVKAFNKNLDGYNLTDGMGSHIKEKYDQTGAQIDIDKLISNGYIKEHIGVDRRKYYTVTPEGQEACGIVQQAGREIGDIGAETPHRVGMELTAQYYESQEDVYRVKRAGSEGRHDSDIVVVDNRGERIAIIEVEAGVISADNTQSATNSVGINDYSSINKDYALLAESKGKSVWVVRNYEVAATVLQALVSSDDTDINIPKTEIKKMKNREMPYGRFYNNYITPLDAEGLDIILTYKQLRNKLSE